MNVDQRFLAENSEKQKKKILAQIRQSYAKTSYFNTVYPVIESCFFNEEENLSKFIMQSILQITKLLGITTKLMRSSIVPIDHSLKKEEKVIGICKQLGAEVYYNSIGGTGLYDKDEFAEKGITLRFLKTREFKYNQGDKNFIPNLSIIDVLMFNGIDKTKHLLDTYELI